MGTRVAFLDFVINWVNNSDSGGGLVLFGQAGTGRSSIAHRSHDCSTKCIVLHHRLSLFEGNNPFRRVSRSRQPLSFVKIALRNVAKDNTALRVATRDYHTLFESLILEPLKDLYIVGPILVVIYALDESEVTASSTDLPTFLAKISSDSHRTSECSSPQNQSTPLYLRSLKRNQ